MAFIIISQQHKYNNNKMISVCTMLLQTRTKEWLFTNESINKFPPVLRFSPHLFESNNIHSKFNINWMLCNLFWEQNAIKLTNTDPYTIMFIPCWFPIFFDQFFYPGSTLPSSLNSWCFAPNYPIINIDWSNPWLAACQKYFSHTSSKITLVLCNT